MASGNIPGGGFTGFVKAEKPLQIKRPSYIPVKEWSPDDPDWEPEEEPLLKKEDDEFKFPPHLQSPFRTKPLKLTERKERIKKELETETEDIEYEPTDVKKKLKVKKVKKRKELIKKELESETEEDTEYEPTGVKKKPKVKKFKIKWKKPLREFEKPVDKDKPSILKKRPSILKKKPTVKEAQVSEKEAKKTPKERRLVKEVKRSKPEKSPPIKEAKVKKKRVKLIADKPLDDVVESDVEDTPPDVKAVRPVKEYKSKRAKKAEKKLFEKRPGTEKIDKGVKSPEERIEPLDKKEVKGKIPIRRKKVAKKDYIPEDLEKEEEEIKDETKDIAAEEEKLQLIPEDEEIPPEEYPEEQDKEIDIRVKFRKDKKPATYTYLKRKRSILRLSPCLDRLLHSRRLQYVALKAMFGFPIGALFGFALYWIVLERMGGEIYLFWLLGIFLGIGFALSTQIRCICLLSIPGCFGRAGRTFVSTYVVAYVIEGPLTNILANARESMRVISCTSSLNLNHTVERYRLMFGPVKEIVLDFVGAGQKVQDDTKELEKAFDDIEHEVRDEDEVRESLADVEEFDDETGGESRADIIKHKFNVKGRKTEFGDESDSKYGVKSELRCEGIFTKGVRGCYDSFEKAYDRCLSYLPIIGYLLCWPMKLTFICDLASSLMGKRSCDSDDVRNPGFGASVDTADGVQTEFEKDFAVQLQYKLTIPEEDVNQLVPEDVSGAMKYSFERRKRNLDFFTTVIDRIMAVLFLLVVNASRKYCNRYLRIIQFDNKYVTSYFRHIDARRKKVEKLTLLPLKKAEKLELSNPFNVKLSAEEKALLVVNGIKLISEAVSVTIILLFDRVFYEFLGLIQRHAHVTYKQTGVHHIKMTIYGDGFVGNMVRGILKGFDKKHSADQVTTTEACLPDPTKLKDELVIRLYLVFLLMLVFMILESYALRLRRVICSFFYPKREKKRIIFLYNDRLKKRRSFLQHMRHRVRKQAREQAIAIDSGVLFSLRRFYPKYFNWISKLGLGLAQCLICKEIESRKCPLIFCPECPFSYCSECFQDTEGKCYVCLPDDDTQPSDNLISEEEQEQLF